MTTLLPTSVGLQQNKMDLSQLYIQPQHGVLQLQREPPGSFGPNAAYLLGAGLPPPTNNRELGSSRMQRAGVEWMELCLVGGGSART